MTSILDRARIKRGIAALALLAGFAGAAMAAVFLSGVGAMGAAALPKMTAVLKFTLLQAGASTVISVGLAVPVAFAIDQLGEFRGRRCVAGLFALPLSLPAIVGVMAMLALAGRNGLLSNLMSLMGFSWKPAIYGFGGILLAHVFFNLPLAVRLFLNSADEIPQAHWKLAEALRFSVRDRFVTLFWPVLRQSLPGAAGLVFMLCVTSFSIVLILGGGPAATTIEVAIYQALTYDLDLGLAAALTLAQLSLVIALLLALNLLRADPAASFAHTLRSRRFSRLSPLESATAWFVVLAAALLIAAPLLSVVVSGSAADHMSLLRSLSFRRALATSLGISALSAAIAVGMSAVLASALSASQGKSALRAVFSAAPSLTLAFPPLMLGAGWFILINHFDSPARYAAVLVTAANAAMAMPFCVRILEPAVSAAAKRHDRLAQSLGIFGIKRFWLIDLPSLRLPLLTAALFAMALSFGDLGVIALFGSDAVLTLPSLLFAKMGSYRGADAAGIALYLLTLTAFLSFAAQRLQRANAHD